MGETLNQHEEPTKISWRTIRATIKAIFDRRKTHPNQKIYSNSEWKATRQEIAKEKKRRGQ